MAIGKVLAVSAMTGLVSGLLLGCGGATPPPVSDPTGAAGAKAACNGPDHTDKNHCNGAAVPATGAASAMPAGTPAAASPPKNACGGPNHTDKNHCKAG